MWSLGWPLERFQGTVSSHLPYPLSSAHTPFPSTSLKHLSSFYLQNLFNAAHAFPHIRKGLDLWKAWSCGLVSLLMAVGPWASHLSLPCGPGRRPIQARSTLNSLFSIYLLSPSNSCTTHPVPRLIPALLQLKPPTLPGILQERAKFPPWLPDSLFSFLSRVSPAMQAFFN